VHVGTDMRLVDEALRTLKEKIDVVPSLAIISGGQLRRPAGRRSAGSGHSRLGSHGAAQSVRQPRIVRTKRSTSTETNRHLAQQLPGSRRPLLFLVLHNSKNQLCDPLQSLMSNGPGERKSNIVVRPIDGFNSVSLLKVKGRVGDRL
jgi:hypothetical protein